MEKENENSTKTVDLTSVKIKTKTVEDDVIYTVNTLNGEFQLTCKGDGTMLISSAAPIMSKAIGGRGDDNGVNAWFDDKHCKSKADSASVILELIMALSE